jgi:hypothetical protein
MARRAYAQGKTLLMSKTGSAYDIRLLPRLNKKKTDILSLTRGKINYERACGKRKKPKKYLEASELSEALNRSTTAVKTVWTAAHARSKRTVAPTFGDAGCSTERTRQRCALAKSACVQLLAWQCMLCTSAQVFHTSESASQNVMFLFHVYGYLGVQPPPVLVRRSSFPSPLPSPLW